MWRRRSVIQSAISALIAPTASVAAPAIVTSRRKLSQDELDLVIWNHSSWLADSAHGRRANLEHCDLSGLMLSASKQESDLTGADLTGADLSGARADRVKFVCTSLQDANLTESIFRQPVFARATLRRANCKNAVWGLSHPDLAEAAKGEAAAASFMDCYIGHSCLDGARLQGFFFNSTFHDSSLRGVDFSSSRFHGTRHDTRVSFAGCDLTDARFVGCHIVAATFTKARLDRVDFSHVYPGEDVSSSIGCAK